MPIPLIFWAGIGIASAFGLGGYKMGEEIGEGVGKLLPLAGVSLIAIAAYNAAKK